MSDVEVTELIEIDANEGVHGVTSPANGMRFVLIKSLDEEINWSKGKYSADEERKMLSSGHAMKNDKGEPSYPIKDEEDLNNAISAVGRGGASHDAIRKHIMSRAKALGMSDKIPDNWNSDGSLKIVAKAEGDMESPEMAEMHDSQHDKWHAAHGDQPCTSPAECDNMAASYDAQHTDQGQECCTCETDCCLMTMDGTGDENSEQSPEGEPVYEGTSPDSPTGMVMSDDGGNPDLIPGSPAWEAKDAATLTEAGEHLAEAAKIVNFSLMRENAEVNAGHANDEEDAAMLEWALDLIQHALKKVAATAFSEQAEANVTKSLSEKSMSEMNQTVEFLQGLISQAENKTPTGAENTDFRKEMLQMDLTIEQLADLVSKSVDSALDARIPKAPTPPTAEEIAAAREILAKAEGEMVESTENKTMESVSADMSSIPSELTDVLKGLADKNTELEDRLAKALGQPAPGGPVLSTQSMPVDGPRGGLDKTPFDGIKSEIAKAEASGDVTKSIDLRQKLGQEILRAAFAGRGYDDSAARQQRMTSLPQAAV